MSIKVNQFGVTTLTFAGREFISKDEILGVMAQTVSEAVRLYDAGKLSDENATGVINGLSAVASAATGIVSPDIQVVIDAAKVIEGVDITSETD